jgi:hypothetical protein
MKETEEREIRITQQFRSRDAMVYDLKGATGRLTLRVSASNDGSASPTWRVAASTSTSPEAVSVSESGVTRAEALHAVSLAWAEKRAANNLPVFDWEAVARALAAVRAI